MFQFYNPHKSYIVNMDYICKFDKKEVIMKNDEKVKISRLKKNHFKDSFYDYIRSRANANWHNFVPYHKLLVRSCERIFNYTLCNWISKENSGTKNCICVAFGTFLHYDSSGTNACTVFVYNVSANHINCTADHQWNMACKKFFVIDYRLCVHLWNRFF